MKVDEILAIIDTGLQTAGDTAYGTDSPGTCWRCSDESPTDLCDGCRVELVDEKQPDRDFVTVLIHLDLGLFQAAIDALVAFGRLSPDLIRRVIDDHIHIESHAPPTTTRSSTT